MPGQASAACIICGRDCSERPCVRDAAGRCVCRECAQGRSAAADPTGPEPTHTSRGAASAEPAAGAGGGYALAGESCPGCGAYMTPEMVLCTRCGFDVRLGRRRRPEDGQPAAREIQRRRVAAEPRVPRAMVFFIVQLIAFAGLFVAGLVRGEWVLMATVVTVHWLLVYIWLMIGAVRDDDLGWAVAAAAILVFPPIVPIVYYYALLISDRSFLKGALGSNAIAMVLLAVLYLKLEGI